MLVEPAWQISRGHVILSCLILITCKFTFGVKHGGPQISIIYILFCLFVCLCYIVLSPMCSHMPVCILLVVWCTYVCHFSVHFGAKKISLLECHINAINLKKNCGQWFYFGGAISSEALDRTKRLLPGCKLLLCLFVFVSKSWQSTNKSFHLLPATSLHLAGKGRAHTTMINDALMWPRKTSCRGSKLHLKLRQKEAGE